VDLGGKGILKSLFVPGGVVFFAAATLLSGGFIPLSAAAVDFYYYAVFIAGILLACRFHSSRILFALIVLLLAHRALGFFTAARIASIGPGRIAFETISFLLPVNFVAFSLVRERGLTIPAITPHVVALFFQSVLVAFLCRPGETTGPSPLNAAFLGRSLFHWTRIPQLATLSFAVALGFLLARFLLYRKPLEAGMLWSLAAAFFSLHSFGSDRVSTAYWATSALLLVTSIIENSYVLAYHDELTSLPARRAFNQALLRLEPPYSIAAVDIDHFKNFNDTYGHDTGDQVLRMVAARLARVGGGGQAFRVGGEEFSILFARESVKDVAPHLEELRSAIEASIFRVRSTPERRSAPRGAGRRRDDKKDPSRRGRSSRLPADASSGELSVTISIGVAEPGPKMHDVEQVIQAADKALYRAKKSGRNRLEIASDLRNRSRQKRSIA